ncbi:hypothetical protein C0995_012040 [Termitomyces sp. Mi166|nr:hypothetical protein C0995_012040 [Termitomyces sp. Mi166\
MWPFTSSYLTIVEEKKAKQKEALKSISVPQDLSSEYDKFINATATEIVTCIENGEWTASQVVEAYIFRAVQAHAATNCLTEVMFDWAREQARDLDNEFSVMKRLRGPLHGVPTSFKDQFDIVGYDSTIGFTQWANKPATTNADLVSQFLAAGAVLFVKTNVPQTMFTFECSNPLWGRSTNPHNDQYTCGGSSGGEGALLAMDGSAVGIGSDIGGSLRIPAAYCGIYSLKPSTGRISFAGSRSPVNGFEGIKTVVGPMARSVEDLQLVSRVVFGVQGDEQSIAPIPYRQIQLPPKLRFGYYTSDNFVKASPACQRAILETVEALRKKGHECIELNLPGASDAFNIFVGLTSADGYKKLLSHLGPDPKENSLWLVTSVPKLPSFVRSLASWMIEKVLGDKIFANLARTARVWNKYGFDAIIAPVQAVPQLPHGYAEPNPFAAPFVNMIHIHSGCDHFGALVAATVLYNVLDHPVGCLPVTHIDPLKDQITPEWTAGPGHGSSYLEKGVFYSETPLYNPIQSAGMPVGIQIVGKKWEEEKVLEMMHIVDDALRKDRGFGPGSWKPKDRSS